MTIAHFGIKVPPNKVEETLNFYLAALSPIGYKTIVNYGGTVVGLGAQVPDFWIIGKEDVPENVGLHYAFESDNQQAVRLFHKQAIEAGGTDNGEPGIREQSSPTYFAAFILDPLGNNVEVVCTKP